jgi:nitroreductase
VDERHERVKPLIRTRQHRVFTEQPVASEDLAALTDVARWTGSSRNNQPWRFIVVRDVELLRRIGDMGHPQTRSLHSAMAAIAIAMPDDDGRPVSHAYDEGRAAERMLIAASLLGIGAGIAWVVPDIRPAVAEALGVPADHYVRTIVAVGHPSTNGRAARSAPGTARLPRDQVVMQDQWR